MTALSDRDALTKRIERELLDGLDEELELEIEDRPRDVLAAEGLVAPSQSDERAERLRYFFKYLNDSEPAEAFIDVHELFRHRLWRPDQPQVFDEVVDVDVRIGDHLYLRTWHDGYHAHWEEDMLVDIERDPHETVNLCSSDGSTAGMGAKLLAEWTTAQLASTPSISNRRS